MEMQGAPQTVEIKRMLGSVLQEVTRSALLTVLAACVCFLGLTFAGGVGPAPRIAGWLIAVPILAGFATIGFALNTLLLAWRTLTLFRPVITLSSARITRQTYFYRFYSMERYHLETRSPPER